MGRQKITAKWSLISYMILIFIVRQIKLFSAITFNHISTNEERFQFYKFKKEENLNAGFSYPSIDYSISNSDFII